MRDGRRAIGVTFGNSPGRICDGHTMQLLDKDFHSLREREQKPSENETLEVATARGPPLLAGTSDFDFNPIPVSAAPAAPLSVVTGCVCHEDRRPAIVAEGPVNAGQRQHSPKTLCNSKRSRAAPSRACEHPVIWRERDPR